MPTAGSIIQIMRMIEALHGDQLMAAQHGMILRIAVLIIQRLISVLEHITLKQKTNP